MTTSALDPHRQANAAQPHLATVAGDHQDRGVEFVYYQTVTHHRPGGRQGRPCPPFRATRGQGVQQHRTAIANLQGTREGVLLGGGVNAAEYTAIPDLDTFAVLPWDTTFGRVFCRLYEPDHLAGTRGSTVRLRLPWRSSSGSHASSPSAPAWSCAPAASPR